MNSKNVIVKMLKSKLSNQRVANQEMDSEMSILMRLNHPHIISMYGAGNEPRKFIVLEHLEGDTLDKLLHTKVLPGKSPSLSLKSSLGIASELASALKYMHDDFAPNATLIHRGTNLFTPTPSDAQNN
jgi:serine/threonine protein kinase